MGFTKPAAAFQALTAHRYESLEAGLHHAGLFLFLAAVALSFYDAGHAFGLMHFTSPWILTSSALLPALGAAPASIATQGDYKRLAGRTLALSRSLWAIEARLDGMQPRQPLTEGTSEAWRGADLDRELAAGGLGDAGRGMPPDRARVSAGGRTGSLKATHVGLKES